MAPNFRLGKRQRELAKKQKREDKRERRLQRRTNPEPPNPPETDPSANKTPAT
jgi:hypothetical protein